MPGDYNMHRCTKCGQDKLDEDFYQSATQHTYWCKECKQAQNKKWTRANPVKRKAQSTVGHHKMWALKSGVPYKRVDLVKLYERDKGVCQICKEPVTWEEASHDLIVPRSKGGPSTWSNSQLV